jgi:hypothetical protein
MSLVSFLQAPTAPRALLAVVRLMPTIVSPGRSEPKNTAWFACDPELG